MHDVCRHLARRMRRRARARGELAKASEGGAVAGATWHAAAGGVDVARVPLVLAGDRARARFDDDAVGVVGGVERAVDVGRLQRGVAG